MSPDEIVRQAVRLLRSGAVELDEGLLEVLREIVNEEAQGNLPATAWVFPVTEQNLEEEVLQRSDAVVVLVQFWATWCRRSQELTSLLESEVRAREGAVRLGRVDVDTEPRLSSQFSIESIPYVAAFSRQQLVDELLGVPSEGDLHALISRLQSEHSHH
jgi:putative thioredoxin